MLTPLSNLTLSECQKESNMIEADQQPLITGGCSSLIESSGEYTGSSFLKRKKKILDEKLLNLMNPLNFEENRQQLELHMIPMNNQAKSSFTEFSMMHTD